MVNQSFPLMPNSSGLLLLLHLSSVQPHCARLCPQPLLLLHTLLHPLRNAPSRWPGPALLPHSAMHRHPS
eukprot:847772-Amphidinium_carterae.1